MQKYDEVFRLVSPDDPSPDTNAKMWRFPRPFIKKLARVCSAQPNNKKTFMMTSDCQLRDFCCIDERPDIES